MNLLRKRTRNFLYTSDYITSFSVLLKWRYQTKCNFGVKPCETALSRLGGHNVSLNKHNTVTEHRSRTQKEKQTKLAKQKRTLGWPEIKMICGRGSGLQPFSSNCYWVYLQQSYFPDDTKVRSNYLNPNIVFKKFIKILNLFGLQNFLIYRHKLSNYKIKFTYT